MWKCPKCGENVEENFEVCWSCGTSKAGVIDPNFLEEQVPLPSTAVTASAASPAAPGALDDDERIVTVTTCGSPAEAYALRLQLEAAGIPVFLTDEVNFTMEWLFDNASVKIQVAEHDAAGATELLASLPPPSHTGPSDEDDKEAK